jgi:hypothetical protein
MALTIARPANDEYAEFHRAYIAAVADEPDGISALERQQAAIDNLRRLTPEQAGHRYADRKWTVREVIGHLADAERVLSYRLLRIARGDATPLPGFDEKAFVAGSNADRRDLDDLVAELAAVRAATLLLVRSLDDEVVTRRGVVNTWQLSARGLVFIIAGHFAHHRNVLRDRYNVTI